MKGNNNKGFTLIELLAAVVILAILVGVSIPIIMNMFDTSKSKMYISDARKLISLAEYKMKASSSDIEKPDEGDCILISMLYLDSTDFDNPPGEGRYLKESSYVVVKNDGGDLEYSVSVVEKLKKGGYKGVELVKKSDLISKSPLKHVVVFKENDILNVETDVNRGFINDKLGAGYISVDNNVTAVYNYPGLEDQSSTTDIPGMPKIVFASLISASSREFNSLDAVLQLRVEDKDTPRTDLDVYIAVDSGYDDATVAIPYGENDTFSYNINFASYGKIYDGNGVKVYIIVKDPEGNETKKTLTYKIHKNVPPEISNSSEVTRRDRDIYHGIPLNMLTAKVKLIVTDDIDDNTGLSVCFKESPTDEDFKSCNDYHSYYDYFSDDNTMEYTFTNCDGGRCKRDGSTHYLTAFVKDSLGGVSKKQFSYTFSVNKNPEIKSLSIESIHESFTSTGSKNIVVEVEATDDVDSDSDLSVRISDGRGAATRSYATQPIYYTINGNYDGSTKTIKVSVIDSEDGSDSDSKSYTMYLNKKPKINSYSIVSSAPACINQALCPPENGGSKIINVSLDAEDDIDYNSLMVCLSLNANSCSGYRSYKNYDNSTPTYTIPHEYDGSTQNIYVFVMDSYGLTDKRSLPYKLYTNIPPVLNYAVFNSRTDGKPVTGSLDTIFNIDAVDDVDSPNTLRFQVIEDGIIRLNNAKLSDYIGFDNDYRLFGGHDGKRRNIEVKVIDTDGATDSKKMTYDVYLGLSPTINLFNVYSDEIPCRDEKYCSSEENGNYNAKYIVKASDDIDDNNYIKVCVSENESTCDNYISYSEYLSGETPKPMSYTFNVSNPTMPYDGATKTLYLFVKDRDENVVKRSMKYKLYNNKAPVITESPVIVSNSKEPGINLPDITYSIGVEDDLDETVKIRYCQKKDGAEEVCTNYSNYHESKTLNNSFFGSTRPSGETYKIYSKIKDSYGKEIKSEEITYQLYTDLNPSIYSKNIVSGSRIYKNSNGDVVNSLDGIEDVSEYSEYTRLKVRFSVDDPLDKYSVCISDNNSSCDNYQGSYDGNNCSGGQCNKQRNDYIIYFDKPGFIENGDNVNLYLFAKDSYDNITSEALYDEEYTECLYQNEEEGIYVYEFNSSSTNLHYGHNIPISIDRCAGKCYYDNPETGEVNNIFARYNTRITYTDKFNSSITCNSDDPVELDYEATCDYKDCFYKNDNYNRNAIGTRLHVEANPWIATINEHIYNCTGYYTLYLSSYTEGNKSITLTKTNTKICNTALDNGEYDYDSNSSNPYVRVAD